MNDEGMRKFNEALDPAITKFSPKKAEDTIVSLLTHIRTNLKTVEDYCARIETIANSSDENARVAADNLLDMLKRIK